MQMVKGGDQLGMSGSEHAVTEYITAHITDTDHSKVIAVLDIHAAHTEVTLDRLPAAAGGDTHGFVIIPNRATRGKGIIEPKVILACYAVCNIRKTCCAFVSGDDQVRIIFVMTHGVGWRDDLSIDDIVGDIKHTAQECLIAGNPFCLEGIAAISHGFGFDDKTTFGADRNDHRVFDHLRFDQAEYFGTKIFHTI